MSNDYYVCPYTKDQMKASALAVANQFRAHLGLPPAEELACGTPGDFYSCAIGATVDAEGGYEILNTGSRTANTKLVTMQKAGVAQPVLLQVENPAAYWFIQRFDGGEFPELIAS